MNKIIGKGSTMELYNLLQSELKCYSCISLHCEKHTVIKLVISLRGAKITRTDILTVSEEDVCCFVG